MPHGKRLTAKEEGQIDGLKHAGFSNRQIAKVIGRSHCVVNSYLKDPSSYGTKPHPGRPMATSDRDRRAVVRQASNSVLSCSQLKAELKLPVSSRSVLRIINKNDFIVRRKMRKAPAIKEENRQKRLDFACSHINSDWSKVVWSDEKKFNLDGPDGDRYYWHDLRKKKISFSRRNFRGGGIMVWAAFGAHGRIKLVFTKRRINSDHYQKILQHGICPYWNAHRREKPIFMQDNASSHTSGPMQDWFRRKRIQVLDWPANSPDLNPQENIWGYLVRKVYANNERYYSIDDLKKAICNAWKTVDQKLIDNLIASMNKRMVQVIQQNGGPIEY